MAISTASELQSVVIYSERLHDLLRLAREIKPESTVEPPLPIAGLIENVSTLHENAGERIDQVHGFASVETAAREIFYSLISSIAIHDPSFVDVWNLLDILLLCGDEARCTPDLVCLLIEELLDSQTTHGCRTVFDYLESRRERLARKDFHKKNLVFLRSCNELLRRLSRAEDAIFCGRVFFFLFQTFPLGDKSSVNLRGEFHVENTTKYEVSESADNEDDQKMDVDTEPVDNAPTAKASTPQPPTKPGSKAVPIKAPPKKEEEVLLSNSELYPIFWRLQQDFSDPTRLFVADSFRRFKKGLDRTITKFKKTPTVVQTQAAVGSKRGTKRRFGEDGATGEPVTNKDHLADNYNPKYLTSRDLFDLELSDLAFQRHILVQALILIDFLLSLTDKAKKRLAALDTTNKSMLYSFTLNEEDTTWATTTRLNITNYLSASPEGRLFNRMVETVLSRDKNWIRWKIESCPSIVRSPVSTESEMDARKGVRDATRVRRLPEKPPHTMDLSFLEEGIGGGLEELKDRSRYTAPPIDELLAGIKTDELDLEMAMDDLETASLQNAIANKRWRIMRQTRASRFSLLNKVEPGKDLDAVFQTKGEWLNGGENEVPKEDTTDTEHLATDVTGIVVDGQDRSETMIALNVDGELTETTEDASQAAATGADGDPAVEVE